MKLYSARSTQLHDRRSDEALISRLCGTDFWVRVNYDNSMGDMWIHVLEDYPDFCVVNAIYYHGYNNTPRRKTVRDTILNIRHTIDKSKLYIPQPVELTSTDELFPEASV